ncbi:flagellar hook-length control protein [Oceanococcus atlanticus]|uniref:Flagellar hook-length control protein n=1 Tax=Oceanococcus atlanticus TaxID=1317117 RepID=A0A1Y1SG38_9GAMM|nr:flagellar hook-length control protein FliK [Oceanococcus atlanticus]ORE88625.1 flagellar hook-length control protein [Oceanococcus atlanticus]
MLEGMLDALRPALRSAEQVTSAGDAEGVDAFSGLMQLVSLPELPLQAYLGELTAAQDAAATETEATDSDVAQPPLPGWLLEQVGAATSLPAEAADNGQGYAPKTPVLDQLPEPAATDIVADTAVDVMSPLGLPAEQVDAVHPSPAVGPSKPLSGADAAALSSASARGAADNAADAQAELAPTAALRPEAVPEDAPMPEPLQVQAQDLERVSPSPLSGGSASNVVPTAPTAAPSALAGQAVTPTAAAMPPSVPVQDLAQHAVATIRHQGADQAEVRISLHPAELGALDLQMEQDGKRLELNITVDNEAARRAVGEQIMQLRERLGEAGMQLARLDVSVRDQAQRQNTDTPSGAMQTGHDDDVKIPTTQHLVGPADGLDLYA